MLHKSKLKHTFLNNSDIAILPFAFFLVLILMTILTEGRFFSRGNISSIAFQLPELGMFTLAIMISMVTGGIDLSIISIANLTNVVMALFIKSSFVDLNAGPFAMFFYCVLTITIGLSLALSLGLLNGFFIAYLEVSPILTTLGTMIFYEGLTLAITKGFVISGLPDMFLKIGGGTLIGIPIPFLIFILFAFLLNVLFKYRPLGKYFFMLGSNAQATKFSGINIKTVLLKAYLMSALYAGIAGIIMLSRFNSANARVGVSYLLLAALLSILGGTDPEGGYGRVIGVVTAVFVLQMVTSGLNLLGITSFVAVALWGLILVAVMYYRHYMLIFKNNLSKRRKL